MNGRGSHVAVVGAGGVGAAVCFAVLTRGVASRVSLYDIDGPRAESEVADLSHGLEFVPSATVTGGADLEVCRSADVVVVTAGAKQQPGQSRLELAAANAAMCRSLVPDLLAVAPDALLLLVTNPVDVVTSVAAQVADLAPGRVFGTGTVLDTSRFRYLLGRRCGVAVQNVHAYIVGEHGDSELALWSSATIGGVPLAGWRDAGGSFLSVAERDGLVDQVRTAAQQIIAGKGATTWAIALATARVLEAILRDERRVLPVTAPLTDLLGGPPPAGIGGGGGTVSLSLPRIVGREGCGPVLPVPVDDQERAALDESARQIAAVLHTVSGDR
jgi:L-lactate dehydrogenase